MDSYTLASASKMFYNSIGLFVIFPNLLLELSISNRLFIIIMKSLVGLIFFKPFSFNVYRNLIAALTECRNVWAVTLTIILCFCHFKCFDFNLFPKWRTFVFPIDEFCRELRYTPMIYFHHLVSQMLLNH